jgi:malonyl CoA-acyl carrier protein transacylase
VSRVLGIARIYEDIANPDERAKAEDQLARTLNKLAGEQNLECKVRLYSELRVVVVKGPAQGVALIEQTISALKENADARKPASGGSKFSSGLGLKN